MGYTSYDNYISLTSASGQQYTRFFTKAGTAPEIAGIWHSLWRVGPNPGPGADPAATPGAAYTDATGSLFFPNQTYKALVTLTASASQNCTLVLLDRLWGVGGVALAGTGNKTIATGTVPRFSGTDAAGNMAFLEVSTVTATTAPTVSMNDYTDQDGNTGQAGGSLAFPAAATNVDTFVGPLPLAAGDTGIRACNTINLSVAAASGVANFIIARPIDYIPIFANITTSRNYIVEFPAMPVLPNGSSIMLAMIASTTTATTVSGMLTVGWTA